MDNKLFPTQEPSEQILLYVREHWYVLTLKVLPGSLMFLIGLSMLTIGPGLYAKIIGLPFYVPMACLLLLFGWLLAFYGFLMHRLNVVAVTDKHIVDIDQKGLFNRRISELSHDNIQDVSASQSGVIATVFGFGSVFVQTAGETPEFEITNVPDPYGVAKKIVELESKDNEPPATTPPPAAAAAPASKDQTAEEAGTFPIPE